MGRIDRITVEKHQIAETALMETAGQLTARHARSYFLCSGDSHSIVILCGKGHNGADGMVAGRWLAKWGYYVQVLLVSGASELSELPRKQLTSLERGQLVKIKEYEPGEILPGADLYIDALLGTGLSGDPREPYAELIDRLNRKKQPVVSVDVPSGLSGDYHLPFNPCVKADMTVTFGLPKLGSLLEPGYINAGKLIVQELGFPETTYQAEAGPCHLITGFDMQSFLPQRRPHDHKGSAGRLLIIAGSQKYPGAAFLTANAAAKAGAGLVSLVGPEALTQQQTAGERDLIFPTNQQRLIERGLQTDCFVELLNEQDAVVIGPGLDQTTGKKELLQNLLPKLTRPAVIDADGLNNLSASPEIFRQLESAVLTPHPGELARLLSKDIRTILSRPVESCRQLVDRTEQTVVLKTSRPLIVHPDGSYSINVSGGPALAKAGSGDVLSGIIGAFLGGGLAPGPAACLGCYLHGAAGRQLAQNQDAVTARAEDVIQILPEIFKQLREGALPADFPLQFESHSPETLQWNPFQK